MDTRVTITYSDLTQESAVLPGVPGAFVEIVPPGGRGAGTWVEKVLAENPPASEEPMTLRELIREALSSDEIDLDAALTAVCRRPCCQRTAGGDVLGFTAENHPYGLNYIHLIIGGQ